MTIRTLALLAGSIVLLSAAPASAEPGATRAAAMEAWLTIQDGTRVAPGWTGNSSTCVVGTESAPSITATLGALNTLRDFAGVQPVTFDPALNQKALAAAVMMRAAGTLSHGPGPTWPCYSSAGADGAANSNLYLGLTGAAATAGYFQDLGHRGPLLDPRAATMGTGSTANTNALYVRGAWKSPLPTAPEAIAWPPPGNVPWPLIRGEWSVNLDVAGTVDSSAVQPVVTIGGRAMAVSNVVDFQRSWYATDANRLGTMVRWDVAIDEAERDADATIAVRLDGIKVNGVPRQFSWSTSAMRAQVPAPVTFTASRTASTVTVKWAGAVERGVPVSGYQVSGFDGGFPLNQTVGPTVRELTAPYSAPTKTLTVQVTPQSRAGYPPALVYLSVPPPGSGTPPPPPPTPLPSVIVPPPPSIRPPSINPPTTGVPGARARFVGRVTLRATRAGRLRAGKVLEVRADVRDERRLRYQWRRGGRSIRGATRRTYRLRVADRGKLVTCLLTAAGTDGVAVRRTSRARRIPRR